MANYDSIQNLIDAGITNATQELVNTKKDDNTLSITGVNWFTYGSKVCTTISVSGNSWFGLGSTNEDLKVNRRDAAVWNIWREEGTLYGYYRFLKIRWDGYTIYNQTSEAYHLTYDVVLFDTGHIFLSMVTVPTTYYSGTFSLGSLTYTKPATAAPYVTFSLLDGVYSVSYDIPDIIPPYDRKYLVQSGDQIYTIADGALQPISGELSAELFQSYGVDDIPESALLVTLDSPTVLYWQDSNDELPTITADVAAVPYPQTIITNNFQINHKQADYIKSASVTCEGAPSFSLSFDDGETWEVHDGSAFIVDAGEGMGADVLEAITADQWHTKTDGMYNMKIKCILHDSGDTLTKVVLNFKN